MSGSPPGSNAIIDGAIAVIHSRHLVAETICVALRGIGFDAVVGRDDAARFAIVDATDSTAIAALSASGCRVLAFGSADRVTVARAVRAGAAWHLGDETTLQDVTEDLRRLASGEPAPASRLRSQASEPAHRDLETLTPREREVLRALVSGRRAADIAHADFVSVTTVRNQIQSILTKLGAHSQLEAVAIAVRAGWTPLAA